MKHLIASILAMLLLVSCGNAEKQTEQSYETESEIEAAMMEGRDAGRKIINREWKDTLQLQDYILEARARRSRYELQKKPNCARAFDKGLVSTVYTVKPDLARSIFPDSLLQFKENNERVE